MLPTVHMVPVLLLQEDMHDFEWDLPYPRQDLYGKALLTDKVVWGELWLADCGTSGMVRSGIVRDGQLYLEQSARDTFKHDRKRQVDKPTLLATGDYRVWLDAWIRLGDPAYKDDARFTKDGHFDDSPASRWKPSPIPHRRYWQTIHVRYPSAKGEPCRISLRSRRFHWFYRLSRLIDVIDHLTEAHHELTQPVAAARDLAIYLNEFLAVVWHSNIGRYANQGADKPYYPLHDILRSVINACENFVDFGAGGDNRAILERQHINNLAQLLWRLINNPSFCREVELSDPVLAQEHRILLSRIPAVLNQVPPAIAGVRNGSVYGCSCRYGHEFARAHVRSWINQKALSAGASKAPFAFDFRAPMSNTGWLNATRRYGVSMINSCSIFIPTSEVDRNVLRVLLKEQSENVFTIADEYIAAARRAGDSEGLKQLLQNRKLLSATDYAVAREYPEFKSEELRAEKLEREIAEAQQKDKKILDAAKKNAPGAVILIESFEIFVKWLVAKAAWQAFLESAEMARQGHLLDPSNVQGKRLWDAGLKTIDVQGSILRALALRKLLTMGTKWAGGSEHALQILDGKLEYAAKWGKGLNAAADIGSAILYSWDLFVNHTYGDKLLEKYLPEDAVTMYGFHLVTWGGKWMVGLGSTIGASSKSPIGAAIHGLGYLAQLIGEVGESTCEEGARVHKQFHRVHLELCSACNKAEQAIGARGYQVAIYPMGFRQKMFDQIAKFSWMPMDKKIYEARFGADDGVLQGPALPVR